MRRINCTRFLLSAVCFGIVLTLSLQSCDKDSGIQAPLPGTTGRGYDPVFNADGGFIITHGMLDKQYNEITFPGTHNSGAWDVASYCDNQDLNIAQQLANGIRHIEFDVCEDVASSVLKICHGLCQTPATLEGQLKTCRDYAAAHPHQVITVKIGDLCNKTIPPCFLGTLESYEKINYLLEHSNLDNYIYNWDPTSERVSPARCYIPDPWPTLREMIDSGKNVMFFHYRNVPQHDVIDEGLYESLAYAKSDLYWFWQAVDLEDLHKLNTRWAPPASRQHDSPSHLFLVECEPDWAAPAGHRRAASRNNDGRKLYQLAKHQEDAVLPDGRVPNFIIIDYFAATAAGHLPIDIVDACNRLNYERFGSHWESSECFWELYPYEFDDSKVDHIRQAQAVKDEVAEAYDDFTNKIDLDGHERMGEIVATSYHTGLGDFKRIPEWAVDDDFFTRWSGENNGPDHAWGIDLGEPKAIDEIAIAWEYPHRRPGYEVYASNDDRFADGISQAELADDSGWTFVAEGARVAGGEVLLWDQKVFQNTGTSNWRYIKVKVTDTGEYEWPTFYELRLFGSAN